MGNVNALVEKYKEVGKHQFLPLEDESEKKEMKFKSKFLLKYRDRQYGDAAIKAIYQKLITIKKAKAAFMKLNKNNNH